MSKVISIGNVICKTPCKCVAEYYWPMQNFWICCNATGDALLSPQFLAANDIKPVIWCKLMFYPKGKTEECKDHFSLFLKIVKKSTLANIQKVTLSLHFRDQYVLKTQEFNEPTQNDTSLWGEEKFFERKLIVYKPIKPQSQRDKKAAKKGAMQNESGGDNLSISLKIDIEQIQGMKKLYVLASHRTVGTLNRDRAKLVNNEEFSDVELLIGKKSLRAHRYILMTRSPGFSVFIEEQIKAKPNEKRIRIAKIKYKVCLEMLRYIYTGRVQDIDDIAADLIIAANKYDLPALKRTCEKNLLDKVKMDNVIEMLQLAFSCESNSLKFTTIGMVVANPQSMRKPNWKTLSPEILNEISKARANSITQ